MILSTILVFSLLSLQREWKTPPEVERFKTSGEGGEAILCKTRMGACIGIVLLVVKNHLYPIPDQYQRFTGYAAIRKKELTTKNPQSVIYRL